MPGFIYMPIRVLSKQIRSGKISPVELTKTFLDRLEKYGLGLNCIVTMTRDLALKQAKRAEREIKAGRYRGLLHGVPYGVKDLLATDGIPTTWGAEPFRKRIIDTDATVVVKLREAGAILFPGQRAGHERC